MSVPAKSVITLGNHVKSGSRPVCFCQVARATVRADSFFGEEQGNYKSFLLSLHKTHVVAVVAVVAVHISFVHKFAGSTFAGNGRSTDERRRHNIHSWPARLRESPVMYVDS